MKNSEGRRVSSTRRAARPTRHTLVALLTYVWALAIPADEGQCALPRDLVTEIAQALLVLAAAGELSFLPGDPEARLRGWLRTDRTLRT